MARESQAWMWCLSEQKGRDESRATSVESMSSSPFPAFFLGHLVRFAGSWRLQIEWNQRCLRESRPYGLSGWAERASRLGSERNEGACGNGFNGLLGSFLTGRFFWRALSSTQNGGRSGPTAVPSILQLMQAEEGSGDLAIEGDLVAEEELVGANVFGRGAQSLESTQRV